jgi:hypothetical protein
MLIGKNTSLGDHCAVINAVATVHVAAGAATLGSHFPHHALQARVAADAADKENVTPATMRHGTLSDLN